MIIEYGVITETKTFKCYKGVRRIMDVEKLFKLRGGEIIKAEFPKSSGKCSDEGIK